MHNRLRLFILCFFIIALPTQSFAGGASCGCGKHRLHSFDRDAHGFVVPMDSWVSDNKHMLAERAQRDIASDGDECQSANGLMRSGSGPCAACCVGAYAPPPVVVMAAVQEAAVVEEQFLLILFSSHTPARIERPPSR